jgi:hypothetical protein
MNTLVHVLVAREVGGADALPVGRRRREALVGEGRRVRPDAGVHHADDNVVLELEPGGVVVLRQVEEVPRPRRVRPVHPPLVDRQDAVLA